MNEPTKRLTLRDLPLAARLTLSAFLLSVGLGYFSALVQLHFQHASGGNPLPTPDDVVERFAGVPGFLNKAAEKKEPVCQLERLIMGPEAGVPFTGAGSMAKVFFNGDPEFKKKVEKNPAIEPKLRADREGERRALQEWIHAESEKRREAYEKDAFPLPNDLLGKPITKDFLDKDHVKIKGIIEERCYKCHEQASQQGKVELTTYDSLAKYMEVPRAGADGVTKSSKQMSADRLAQSTHAHLLSFSMLWMLTGLIFAFTSYPGWIRAILSPIVLVAQIADVSCWWLARLEGHGPYFALAIVGTGAVVGVGLVLQIVLSLFNMYSWKGKAVLLLLFVAAGGGGYILYDKVIEPTLAQERNKAAK